MTANRISLVCWLVFGVMSLGFLPISVGIIAIHALPVAVRAVLVAVVILGLWWGPFGYAMYLTMAVIKNGDPRLLKRGVRGTAVVLSGKATNEVIQSGEFAWEAPRVYKYRLRVSISGKNPYETDCSVCATGITEGTTVDVAVSPRNRKRVAIDLTRLRAEAEAARSRGVRPFQGMSKSDVRAAFTTLAAPTSAGSSNTERLEQLARLGRLHATGVLTDAEFAAEKARILAG
ncbi:SHOCT domain-containing protein [Streptacidiphilus sp. EB129]|uniref:SHOCT domain-containing protein n=1 Tax=Streptacidiphilus sp. EB129 TaxID=3156262 RepID=UPI003513E120